MVHDIVIRPARSDEQATLESLQRRSSLNNPGDRDALLANPDAIALPIEQIAEGCVFVAERDGSVAGFTAMVPRPDGGAELDALFVEPHFWKQGIGRRLVEHVADIARRRTATFLHVIGNPHAEGFYLSCGFLVSGTVETRFGVGLDMRMAL
jgi:GNAT superfamily N-acetyltransferase